VRVRHISADESPLLRALRLTALLDAPTAFGSTWAREHAFPESLWRQHAADGAAGIDRVTFIAEAGPEWIGLATGLAYDPEGGRGPCWSGCSSQGPTGAGGCVTSTNQPGLRLYQRCGCVPTGATRPHATSRRERNCK
jgi:hypothetical protein